MSGFIKCSYCPNKMPEDCLGAHVERKHQMVKCSKCDEEMLKDDSDDHFEHNHKMVQCSYCNNQMQAASMDAHVERKHQMVECSHCDEVMQKDILDAHIQKKHVMVMCKYCNNYMPEDSLKAHHKRKHEPRLSEELSKSIVETPSANDLVTHTKRTGGLSCGLSADKNTATTNGRGTDNNFYFIRVSEQEMKKLLENNRIYPAGGNLCLKDS